MDRVTPLKPLSPMQYAVACLLGIGQSFDEIAAALHIKRGMVRSHIREANRKLPGDLPAKAKLVAWVRGASLDVLEGTTLRAEFLRDAMRREVTVSREVAKL